MKGNNMSYQVITTNLVDNTVKTETYSNMMAAYTAKARIDEFADFGGKKVFVEVVEKG
jgi:hypothetical protein